MTESTASAKPKKNEEKKAPLHTMVLQETVYLKDQLPVKDAPQIALAGRSNVGKSSLVNALAGRHGLARISATPGKTRSINFYEVQPDGFYIVDLPGYGYAKCSKEERIKWGKLIEIYVQQTPSLKAMVVLLDCRLEPQKPDVEMLAFATQNNIRVIPILTKADKCKQQERFSRQRQWAALINGPKPIITSSGTGLGIAELWKALQDVAMGN